VNSRAIPAVLAGLCLFVLQTASGRRGSASFIEPATPRLAPGQVVTPTVLLHNDSFRAIEFPATLQVRVRGQTVFVDSFLIVSLPGESTVVRFDDLWCVDTLFVGYLFEFYVRDADTFEKIGSRYCMTTTDTFYSYAGAVPPTIDGYLDSGEWDDAYRADISNLCGWGDSTIWPAGSALFLFKHDNGHLYMAAEMPPARTRDVGDQIGLYIDEDNDGLWEPDSSEGTYGCIADPSGDEVLYRPLLPGGAGTLRAAPGSQCAYGTQNGHLVFESKFPFGNQVYELTINNSGSDTLGLFLFARDVDSGVDRIPAWSPMMLDDTLGFLDPALQGKLILKTLQSGDVGIECIIAPVGTIDTLTTITPVFTIRNHGTTPMSGWAFCAIRDTWQHTVYNESIRFAFPGSPPSFPPVRFRVPGFYFVACSVYCVGDMNPANNVKFGTFRVVGRLGLEHESGMSSGPSAGATVVSGALFLPRDMTELPSSSDRVPRPTLLDATGRKVMDLLPGANDVSPLAPGVYFYREQSAVHVRKVVLAR